MSCTLLAIRILRFYVEWKEIPTSRAQTHWLGQPPPHPLTATLGLLPCRKFALRLKVEFADIASVRRRSARLLVHAMAMNSIRPVCRGRPVALLEVSLHMSLTAPITRRAGTTQPARTTTQPVETLWLRNATSHCGRSWRHGGDRCSTWHG